MAHEKPTKILAGADRAKFLALSNACGDPNQLARIKARLALNKFVMEHGEPVCQATYDDILKRRKKTK
jgi:hypothetical protein